MEKLDEPIPVDSATPSDLPSTWTITPTSTPTIHFPALYTKPPSPTPTETPTWMGMEKVIQGNIEWHQWLVKIENLRVISLQKMLDNSHLLYGKIQHGPYQEEPLLLRIGSNGQLIWQKLLSGIDPVKVVPLPRDKILLLERDSYTVFTGEGELYQTTDIQTDPNRVQPLGFDNLQSNIAYKDNEVGVMDTSGVTSVFDLDGSLIRQEYTDIAGKYQGWRRWFNPEAAYFIRSDNTYNFGYQYRIFRYEEGVYQTYTHFNRGSENVSDRIIPENGIYVLAGYRDEDPMILSAVEGAEPGRHDIWMVSVGKGYDNYSKPGFASQRDFTLYDTGSYTYIFGSMIRLYQPLDGKYLRIATMGHPNNYPVDLLFGDGKTEGLLAGAVDQLTEEITLAVNMQKKDSLVYDLYLLRLDPNNPMGNCPWYQPAGFGPTYRESGGRGIGGGRFREETNFFTLDFKTADRDVSPLQVEEITLEIELLCSMEKHPPTVTPIPPASPTPYSGPTWTPTSTP